MAAVNTINFPLTSPFRDPSQVPLLVDPPTMEAHDEGYFEAKEDSLSMQELMEQTEAQMTR